MPKATDFLPSRYQNKTSNTKTGIKTDPKELDSIPTKKETAPSTPFAGLGDDDSKEIPNYSVAKITEASQKEAKADSVPTNTKSTTTPSNPRAKKRKANITGVVALLFLVVGVAASYFLINQNQDIRQQAHFIECDPIDPYCECDSRGLNCTIMMPNDPTCPNGYSPHNGNCYHDSCFKSNGELGICGGVSDGDPCTEDSYGGDWCDDPSTSHHETCSEMGLIRCKCGPGDENGWWVIGVEGQSCNDLCDEAEIDCDDCPPEPTATPTDTPPTGTPTASPTPIACGETGCQNNSDCDSGLTCQQVSIDNQTTGICALGSNQLFCAAEPNVENCCEATSIPVCNSIDMLNANNTLMTENDDRDLTSGDQVKFQCTSRGNQSVDFDYEFRILTPSGQWVDITDNNNITAKNISAPYTISEYGPFVAQARICVENECQRWEDVPGAPTTKRACETDNDCGSAQYCYQPPMPPCDSELGCTQVMPDKYCEYGARNTDLEIN